MSPERWQRISTLLSEVLEQPTEHRAALLDAACAGDEALRSEMEALLNAAVGADQYFDDLADKVLLPLAPLATEAPQETHIGAYQVLHLLGQGGMGRVYLAERADGQFKQRVALKIIKRGLDTDRVRQRFLRERQILARLQHPHIARLLDGGITDDGRPFFVMEQVDGLPLTDYCNQHCLGIDARLRLFMEVGRAVQYAHRNLVVHRDLKPSNILVTQDETGTPQVKLLDFGIAKLLSEEDNDFGLTQAGMQVMTPAYAAPEQVRGEAITTATDVYALGVVLYELLAGSLPHQTTEARPDALAITDTEPVRPSTLVEQHRPIRHPDGSAETLTPEAISKARSISTTALRRRLEGDLDVIVLKALRKEPERRYASVEAFTEDIQRHLHGLPITARPDTLPYRMAKFIHRNRAGVASAGLVVLALFLGFASTIWQARIASSERDDARQQAARAEQVTEFLIDIFEEADPSAVSGDTLTAQDILDQGLGRVQRDFVDQPETQARLLDAMGRVYQKLGILDKAAPLLEQALALRQSIFASPHPLTAQSLFHLGALRHAQGRYEEAEQLYRVSLSQRQAVFGNLHPDVAESMNRVARMHLNKGQLAAADSLLTAALVMQRALLGETHTDVAGSLNDLAMLRNNERRHQESEQLYREALAIHRLLDGDESINVATTLNNLTVSLMNQQRYEEAEQLGHEALAVRLKLYGPEHSAVAQIMNTLGVLLMYQERYAEADSFFVATLALRKKLLGPDHPNYTSTLSNRAVMLYRMEDYDTAVETHREVLALREKAYGPSHIRVAASLLALGQKQQGDLRGAENALRRALTIYEATDEEPHRNLGSTQVGLGDALMQQQRYEEALPFLRQGLDILRGEYGETHLQTVYARSVLGACLVPLKQYEEAEMHLLASYPILREERGENYRHTRQTRQALHNLYLNWGKTAQARSYGQAP